MIEYPIDTSALWRLLRDGGLRDEWSGPIGAGALHVCEATEIEFLHSAMNAVHRDELRAELRMLCAYAPVPERAWQWVEGAQYRLTQSAQHRSAGPIDLLSRATAVHHGLTVLHVDHDFAAVARVVSEVDERDFRAGTSPAE
ncbi:putative nucleic acid-binding protein [Stackebrandtia albiflava]|uniref:Ribonuclease VapC n=1 Tax=Stackebrandtia albiflava TaxID=406432 RepID=A0A562UPL1_9ACTN|nr:PIN domain-containing protein [Stackebrandtia albiflava]TWJ07563.1 putative nucleic acid-binding protein [Stackebrandtia albiflava]